MINIFLVVKLSPYKIERVIERGQSKPFRPLLKHLGHCRFNMPRHCLYFILRTGERNRNPFRHHPNRPRNRSNPGKRRVIRNGKIKNITGNPIRKNVERIRGFDRRLRRILNRALRFPLHCRNCPIPHRTSRRHNAFSRTRNRRSGNPCFQNPHCNYSHRFHLLQHRGKPGKRRTRAASNHTYRNRLNGGLGKIDQLFGVTHSGRLPCLVKNMVFIV